MNGEKMIGIKKTNEEFIQQVYDLVGSDYTFLENYINAKRKMLVRHNICGNEYYANPCKFLQGKGCRKCSVKIVAKKQTKPLEKFLEQVSKIGDGKMLVKSEYKNAKTKVLFFHDICKREFYSFPYSFLRGNGCRFCNFENGVKKRTKTNEEFCEELSILHGGEYTPQENYTSINNKILMKHNKCGYIWKVKTGGILGKTECPKCKNSKGENKIEKFLISLGLIINVDFFEQKKFDDCKSKICLPFDFYIPKSNLLIEYDGEFHYKVFATNDENKLKRTQIRDQIKTEYCKKNSINLLRIPYTYFNDIENILSKELPLS